MIMACPFAVLIWGIGFMVVAGDGFLAWAAKTMLLATQSGAMIYVLPRGLALIVAMTHQESVGRSKQLTATGEGDGCRPSAATRERGEIPQPGLVFAACLLAVGRYDPENISEVFFSAADLTSMPLSGANIA
jgi:hypothetical protein